jgi:hypothetical protein
MKKDSNKYSSFWADFSKDDDKHLSSAEKESSDLIRLTSYKKSISNFVSITTNQNIPVLFDVRGDDSYTDGKSVTISAKMNEKDFDSTVGLALHEGSHVKLTDFSVLHRLRNDDLPKSIADRPGFKDRVVVKYNHKTSNVNSKYIQRILKDIINIVEDRRIDNYIYTTAPGYKGYYQAMYDKYFNDPLIDKALESSSHRELDWDSYMFRLINIINPHRDLDALPVLREVFDLIDLPNINRLKNTTEVYELSGDIFRIIEDSLPTPADGDGDGKGQPENDSDESDEGDGTSTSGDGDSTDTKSSGNSNEGGGGATSKNDSDGTDDSDGDSDGSEAQTQRETGSGGKSGSGNPQLKDLTDAQKKRLEGKIDNQKKFQNNETKKTKISKKDGKDIETLSKSGITQEVAGESYRSIYGRSSATPVTIVDNLTKSLIDSGQLHMASNVYARSQDQHREYITKGVQLGTMLGRRLKVRSESRSLFTTRLNTGKIDRRLINEIGHGNDKIFSTLKTENRKKAFIHISIDASSSMGTQLFGKAQTTAVAIAKAASMTNNMDVVISYRGIMGNHPLVLIAYDSRKDKFSKITSIFKYIRSHGTTPEGLCYEAIKKQITSTVSLDTDSYLLNISDGMPGFENDDIRYAGSAAVAHTKAQIQMLQRAGINILSYFVSSYSDSGNSDFVEMYGKTAESININELIPLAKSLNKLFE